MLLAMHEELLVEHGGATGVRDMGLLSSALGRPKNLHAYEEQVPIHKLAASYAFGIAKNHPFVDGNKRSALIAVIVFVEMNGFELIAAEEDAYQAIIDIVENALTEDGLAVWMKANIRPLD